MERAVRDSPGESDSDALMRLWSEPVVDALLSSLTHVRSPPPLRMLLALRCGA